MEKEKKTKIVATLGPASASEKTLAEMVENGVDVVRLNFSYGTLEEHRENIKLIRKVFEKARKQGPVLVDTRGPEIRLKSFLGGQAELKKGQEFILTREEAMGDSYRASINIPEIFADIKPGFSILIDDGMIELVVNEVKEDGIYCLVKNQGIIKDGKGINIPGAHLSIPVVTSEDKKYLEMAVDEEVDFVAASFIRTAEDVLEVRKVIEDKGSDIPIIAKIETRESVKHLDEILEVADGVMVARGDLGVEIETEDVPHVQKKIIKLANKQGKPVITATQMLESMTSNPRPTRAEASDVANAIFDGTDAVMLSGETAIGNYPVEAVNTMKRISMRTERELPDELPDYNRRTFALTEHSFRENNSDSVGRDRVSTTEAIAHSTCQMAVQLGTRAILTSTRSGFTARMVAKYKPPIPIIAVTPSPVIKRRLSLTRGVYPLISEKTDETDEMLTEAIKTSREAGYLKNGDLVVLTAGAPPGITGTTNLIRVHTVGSIKTTGNGLGKKPVTGRVSIVESEDKIEKIDKGDIVVLNSTTRKMVPKLSLAAGIISIEDGLTCQSAIIGLELGLPVVVGAKDAFNVLQEGEKVTIDPFRGLVYAGEVDIL